MVYIYKKQIGDRSYYYLRASVKKGDRLITKDIAYLGSSLEDIKSKLENLPKYSQQIRKAYRTIQNFIESNRYLEKIKELKIKKDTFLNELTERVESCKLHYNSIFNNFDGVTKREILKNFVVEFAFNTTSIEGNTINIEEARKLLTDGLTPKDKTLREIYDIQNTEKVFFSLLNLKDDISHEFIIDVHKKLMENIDNRFGYRVLDVRVIKSNFKATPAPYVKTDMGLLLRWYNENKNFLHPLVLASIFHHKFERIHPFMDGNGRTGRMILNYILLFNNYPPLIVRKKSRDLYLKSLKYADKIDLFKLDNNYLNLINFIANQLIGTYWNIFL